MNFILLITGWRRAAGRICAAGRTLMILLGFLGLVGSSAAQSLTLTDSFEAIPYTGWIPCDPVIAAGPASLVTMVNSKMVIFDKKGTKLFEQSLSGASGFWGGQNASSSVAEPWVIFDPNSSRFVAVAADFGSGKGAIYLAISKSATPLLSTDWQKYRIERSGTHQNPAFAGVPTYPDYVRAGVDAGAVYITSVHFAKDQNVTMLFSHAEAFGIDKNSLLSGGDPIFVYDEPVITGDMVFSLQPAIVYGPAPAMYFVQSVTRRPSSEIVVHAVVGRTRTPSVVAVPAFDRPPNVPQPGSSTLLDNIDARVMSAVVRNGSLWTAHAVRDPAVDAESLVRWYELNVSGFPGGTAVLAQSGNVDPGTGVHAWLPHIEVDAAANMALGFSVGGTSRYASIGYTGRRAGDPLGFTMPVRIARAGAGAYTLQGWGEYSGLSIDPDGRTFWLFHEYATSGGQWQTFAGAFQVDARPKVDVAYDGFETGNFSGVTGWVGAWATSGDVSILTSSGPAAGSSHVRLRTGNGDLERTGNISQLSTLQLGFWAKVASFEGNDRADVRVSTDGVSFQTVWSFTAASSDGLYHYYPINLTSLLPASQLRVAFEAHMDGTDDIWYLDEIRLSGEPSPGFNFPPVANAGPDQSLTDNDNNGSETVLLNGSASSDSDGTITSYAWAEGASQLGTGSSLTRTFAVGLHTVTLTVTDNLGATASDSLVIEVKKKRK